MTKTGDIIPEVGQVWDCRNAEGDLRRVSILAVDSFRKECIVSWFGMAQSDRVTFDFLNDRGTLVAADEAAETLQIKEMFDDLKGETNG